MASSLNTAVPLFQHPRFRSASFGRRQVDLPTKWARRPARQTSTAVNAVSPSAKDGSSMAAPALSKARITELEREREEERTLADEWQAIHGDGDWAGMLDPMDPLLRLELIRYGDMTQACYDSFDFDPTSRYCGSCKYKPGDFFRSLGLAAVGYNVTRYLYATESNYHRKYFARSRQPNVWSEKANWIGYVAVSGDEATRRMGHRDIIIAWRGTETAPEWASDFTDFLVPVASEGIPSPDDGVTAELGFVKVYTTKDPTCRYCTTSPCEQIRDEVRRLVRLYPADDLSITVTGHSLGSALAILSAYDIAESRLNVPPCGGRRIPVCVFSYAGPRVGNLGFKERLEALGVKVLRVVNVNDVVPKVPGIFPEPLRVLVEWLPWSYCHVGVELEVDNRQSPFLKNTTDISCFHNLEAYLHLVDGYHGKGRRFVLATGRDTALVNKSPDFLVDDLLIPPRWRVDQDKGLVKINGRWTHPDKAWPDLDVPTPAFRLNKC